MFTKLNSPSLLVSDCHEVYESGQKVSGVYQILPEGSSHPESVYCEMVNGTGWTTFQRRVDGTLSFNRVWLEYKYGFGSLYGEFWLGNQILHRLTSQGHYRLKVDLWDWEGHKFTADYDTFRLESQERKYLMHVRGYHGDAGESIRIE